MTAKTKILTKEESIEFIKDSAEKGISVITHPVGGCSAWRDKKSLATGRHYGELKYKLEKLGLV